MTARSVWGVQSSGKIYAMNPTICRELCRAIGMVNVPSMTADRPMVQPATSLRLLQVDSHSRKFTCWGLAKLQGSGKNHEVEGQRKTYQTGEHGVVRVILSMSSSLISHLHFHSYR